MMRIRQGSLKPSLAFFIYPLSLFLITAAAYGRTIAPGLSWANGGTDGGDLITAAAMHGVAHPSGYPTYLALAWIFQQIPLGSLAFRTNLLSAVCTILAVLVLFYTCRRLFGERPFSILSAWAAALLFGISPLVWSQAVITEVYALQALFTAVILFQAFSENKYRNKDFSRGLVMGLAMGNHLTSLFLIPLLFWDGKILCPELGKRLPKRLFGVLAGSLIYLLLPLWASGNPPINWGNPVTPNAFFALISGEIYQSNFTFIYSIDRLRGLAGLFWKQFNLVGLVIGLFHLLGGWAQIKKTFPLVWIFLIHCIFSIIYGSFDSYVYLIPAVMAFSIWIGFGIQELTQFISTRWQAGWIVVCILLVAGFGYQVIQVAPKVDASKDQPAEIFGRTVLKSLPQNALLITEDDEATFSLWYFHFGLKMRGDIAVIVKGLLPYDWYIDTLKRTYPGLLMPQTGNWVSVDSIIEANPSRPSCKIKDLHSTEIICSAANRYVDE
jgi:hypothetical protein